MGGFFTRPAGVTWPRVTVLVVNLGVVSYLLFVLIKNGGKGGR